MSYFSIAGLQLELDSGNNLDRIEAEIRKTVAVYPWVHMVLLPELASYGPSPVHAQESEGEAFQFYSQLASELDIWICNGSIFEAVGEQLFNTSRVFSPSGECVASYNKIYPFHPYEGATERGADFCVFDIPNVGRFGVSICYDQWFPEVTRQLTWMGAEIILCPTLTSTIDRDLELAISRTNAALGQCYFVNINAAGNIGVGRSIVVDPHGRVVHQAASAREIITVEINLSEVRRSREVGVMGLAQTMKCFRDNPVEFDVYKSKTAPKTHDLGELETPPKHKLDP